MLWRLRTEPKLLAIASDPDTRRLEAMEKAVRRDIHKMHAFVRFRKIGEGNDERYVAWFEPDHFIVERNADFFVRRFTGMRWTILTPYASADWDGERLAIGPGAAKGDAPARGRHRGAVAHLFREHLQSGAAEGEGHAEGDAEEILAEPSRGLAHSRSDRRSGQGRQGYDCQNADDAGAAPRQGAGQALAEARAGRGAEDDDASTISELREAAKGCRRCPLWRDATQTVFGEGPDNAKVVFVGEQPGDQEDLAGKPFVGPAGKVFDAILDDAGVDRQKVYVTNAVKHFKFEPRGKRRIHSKPNAGEVQACRWWIDRELELIKPDLAVALGATAALSLLARLFR